MQDKGTSVSRRVIPRWRPFNATPSDELVSATKTKHVGKLSRATHDESLRQWKDSPSIKTAANLISGANLFGPGEEELNAAQFLVSHGSRLPASVTKMARRLCGDTGNSSPFEWMNNESRIRLDIRHLKRRLVTHPRDALAAMELARLYVLLGQSKAASANVERALIIAPENRYVLRSASRFFVHVKENEQALFYIRRSESRKYDPWVKSAEVALLDLLDKSPNVSGKELKHLAAPKKVPRSMSELIAGYATLELKNGTTRMAKKLFNSSLTNSTENALAQALWAKTNIDGLNLEVAGFETQQCAYEAAYLRAIEKRESLEALGAAHQWLVDEPFSVRPAISGSYVASLHLQDFDKAISFVDRGLVANPYEPTLMNNKLVALVMKGELQEARRMFEQLVVVAPKDEFDSILLAAEGLIAFKEGNAVRGRELYQKAALCARNEPGFARKLLSRVYWLECEILAGTIDRVTCIQAIDSFEKAVKKFDPKERKSISFDWKVLQKRLASKMAETFEGELQNESQLHLLFDSSSDENWD